MSNDHITARGIREGNKRIILEYEIESSAINKSFLPVWKPFQRLRIDVVPLYMFLLDSSNVELAGKILVTYI